ncbi:MAG: family 16 glycosylhydrolase [Verrucomicrobiota bacterium]
MIRSCVLTTLFLLLSTTPQWVQAALHSKGLVLHLDSSNADSVKLNAEGKVVQWLDQSGNGHHVTANPAHAPVLISQALEEKSAVRFEGNQWMNIPSLSEKPQGYSIFIVFQRSEGQVSDRAWQRILSATTEEQTDDTKEPSILLTTGENTGVMKAQIFSDLFRSRLTSSMTLGARHLGHAQQLQGDIAEVLIYDRSFIVYEPIDAIEKYLQKKWNLEVASRGDWTLNGPLPQPLPVQLTNSLPLSDQENRGNWVPFKPMWDDFDGETLDTEKWYDHNPFWYGRAPGRFLSRNVKVADGYLQLTTSKDPSLPHEQFYNNGLVYHDYVSASVVSTVHVNYGYFEIRARPMDSAASSAWWFTGSSTEIATGREQRLEIDMFEIGGNAADKEYSYNMNLHMFKTRDFAKHYSLGGIWQAERRLADDFRIYGIEWTPDIIKYYVDGVLVRRAKNTHWHGPQLMLFDSETMFDWLGVPEDTDLPSTFKIDYVRAWKNSETENDWRKVYRPKENLKWSRITKYVRSMDP